MSIFVDFRSESEDIAKTNWHRGLDNYGERAKFSTKVFIILELDLISAQMSFYCEARAHFSTNVFVIGKLSLIAAHMQRKLWWWGKSNQREILDNSEAKDKIWFAYLIYVSSEKWSSTGIFQSNFCHVLYWFKADRFTEKKLDLELAFFNHAAFILRRLRYIVAVQHLNSQRKIILKII